MKEQKMNYEAPMVEVLEVQVEKGFATSGDAPTWNEGGELQSGAAPTSFF